MHKSTQVPPERLKKPSASVALDTSEQLPPDTKQAFSLKTLEKRARAKFITNIVAFPLSKLRSPLEKAYKLTERCSSNLTETPGKLVGLYCGCRWCLVCSRIRTARLITGYMPAIEKMDEKWFLTLSRPNVCAADLESEIQYYLRSASLIQRHLREKRKLKYSSLRKIECTYNAEANSYHPHFHFIFDDFQAADLFLQEWLERNPTAKLNKGNLLKKADNSSCMELFKYFTKVVSKSKTKTPAGESRSDYQIHLAALDIMFLAMRAVRTFQPCGVIKAISEEVEPEQAMDSGRAEVNFHKWIGHDWVNETTEQTLTGYIPAPGIQDISNHLVYPAGVAVEVLPELMPFYVHKQTGEVVPNENVHLVRGRSEFAKVYPLLPAERQKRSCSLTATPESSVEAQPVPIDLPPPVDLPAQLQLSLFSIPLTSLSAKKINAHNRRNLHSIDGTPSNGRERRSNTEVR
jgi:hypothetical protein